MNLKMQNFFDNIKYAFCKYLFSTSSHNFIALSTCISKDGLIYNIHAITKNKNNALDLYINSQPDCYFFESKELNIRTKVNYNDLLKYKNLKLQDEIFLFNVAHSESEVLAIEIILMFYKLLGTEIVSDKLNPYKRQYEDYTIKAYYEQFINI